MAKLAIVTNNKVYPVSWLKEQHAAGKLNTGISLQRNEVWGPAMKSNFIVSLLMDIPIESLLYERVEDDDEFNVLDGKQRTLTLCSFLDDEFVLSSRMDIKSVDGVDLVKKSFLNLPEKLRNKILTYQLTFAVLEPLDEEQRENVFYMRNQSVHLSKMDLSRVVLGKKDRELMTKLLTHNFVKEKFLMTTKARQNHDDLKVMLQFLMLKTTTNTGFSASEIMDYCSKLKEKTLSIPEKEVKATLDFLDKAFPEQIKILKKIHLPAILWLADVARNAKAKPEDFGSRVIEFFDELTEDHPYSIACQSGRSKRPDVQARLDAMKGIMEGIKINPKLEE